MPLGQSFAPLGDPMDRQQGPMSNGPVNPVQEAIKTLSLKIPRTPGAAPAPRELLTGMGMAGMPQGGGGNAGESGNPILDALMRMIRGGFGGGPQSLPSQAGAGGFEAPAPQARYEQPPQPSLKPRVEFIPTPGGVANDPREQAPERDAGFRAGTGTGNSRIYKQ